jgi:C4-dicarboxylate transporter DctM subunit
MSLSLVLATVFIVCLLLTIPVAVSLGLASLVTILKSGVLPLAEMAKSSFTAVDSFPLLAIPLFILAGTLMQKGGLTERIVDFAKSLVGKSTGGLASVTILGCALFAAISGSGPATTAAIGSILIPPMIKEGYDHDFAGAVTASSGGIGIVIPPSIPMIIYGVTAQVSITKLFLAGFIPGILLATFLFIASYTFCKRHDYYGSGEGFTMRGLVRAAIHSKWALLAPIIILGGIYSGIFTVTEAAVVAVFYSVFTGFFIYKRLNVKELLDGLTYATRVTGVVLLILGASGVFGRLIAVLQIPQTVSNGLLAITENPILLLLLIELFLIFVGMWMETLTQIIILVPIFLPVVQSLGVDPIHFGIIVVAACEIGFQTPPLGVNLFVAQEISGSSLEGISKHAMRFTGAEIAALTLVTVVPPLSLFFPRLLGY